MRRAAPARPQGDRRPAEPAARDRAVPRGRPGAGRQAHRHRPRPRRRRRRRHRARRPLRWTEADIAYDLAARLEGRLAAAGMRVHLTRGPVAERAAHRVRPGRRSPTSSAPTCSSRCTSTATPNPTRVRRRDLPLRPVRRRRRHVDASASGWPRWCSARSSSAPGMRDCRIHAKTWDLLRLTRMPAVRVEVGYLTSPEDRAMLIDPLLPRPGRGGDRGRRAADVPADRVRRHHRLDRRRTPGTLSCRGS